MVSNHQQYSDALSQCKEWLQSISDRLDICCEASTDKHSMQNKLDRVDVSGPDQGAFVPIV